MGNNCCNPDNDNKDSLKTDGETMQIGHDANYDRQEKQVSSQPGLESTKPSPNVFPKLLKNKKRLQSWSTKAK